MVTKLCVDLYGCVCVSALCRYAGVSVAHHLNRRWEDRSEDMMARMSQMKDIHFLSAGFKVCVCVGVHAGTCVPVWCRGLCSRFPIETYWV